MLILNEKNTFTNQAQTAKDFLIKNRETLTQSNINKLLEVIEYTTLIYNLEEQTILLDSLYKERFNSNIKRTAIFATPDEILQAQVISYNFLKVDV